MNSPIIILDFGSQFAHLIGNRVRRLSAYSEIVPVDTPAEEIQKMNPAGIILSGGPQSVFADDSPKPDPAIFDIDVPFLGICYGHQLIAHHYNGRIEEGNKEFGHAQFTHTTGKLFSDVPDTSDVWMNHGDSVMELPGDFEITGTTKDCPIAAYENVEKNIYSVQFHPEVTHSEYGMKILENFVDICDAKGSWDIEKKMEEIIVDLQNQVGDRNVFLLVSGGVDSSVAFALLSKAIGEDRVYGLFVDTGLLRKNEGEEVARMLGEAGFTNLHIAEEGDYFLSELKGIFEPEAKRKKIGSAFLEVKRKWAQKLHLDDKKWLLGQGTIYPDHIETGGTAHASKIKTHHNRVPEIEKLIEEGRIVEPIADFYKDEVREIGRQLGLSEEMVERHPFPGPGLGVRMLCQDSISPLDKGGLGDLIEKEVFSQFGVESTVFPIKSVGVQGDARSYRHPIALFASESPQKLTALATKIPNAFHDINRVIVSLSHREAPTEIFSKIPAEMSADRVQVLQEADAAVRKILIEEGLVKAVWQFPVVLLPIGLEENTESIILRPIQSENAMTATAIVFEDKILKKMTDEILKIPGISGVFIDITSKPPGTIEWE